MFYFPPKRIVACSSDTVNSLGSPTKMMGVKGMFLSKILLVQMILPRSLDNLVINICDVHDKENIIAKVVAEDSSKNVKSCKHVRRTC